MTASSVIVNLAGCSHDARLPEWAGPTVSELLSPKQRVPMTADCGHLCVPVPGASWVDGEGSSYRRMGSRAVVCLPARCYAHVLRRRRAQTKGNHDYGRCNACMYDLEQAHMLRWAGWHRCRLVTHACTWPSTATMTMGIGDIGEEAFDDLLGGRCPMPRARIASHGMPPLAPPRFVANVRAALM